MSNLLEKVIVREASADDASSILEYIDKISSQTDFLTFGKGEFNLSLEEEKSLIEKSKSDDVSLFLLAEVDGRIVGNLNFTPGTRPRTIHFGKFGVSVLKDYWGQGIGNSLIKYMLNWARSNNVTKKINLEVREDHINAINLYKKIGFKVEGKISKYFFINGHYFDAIIMGVEID